MAMLDLEELVALEDSLRGSFADPQLSFRDAGRLYAGDTSAILEEWVGIDSDEVAELIASGVLDS